MLSSYAHYCCDYVAQLVEFMWMNDVILMSIPFIAGLVCHSWLGKTAMELPCWLRSLPQYFPKRLSASTLRPSIKREPRLPYKYAAANLEPLFPTSGAWEVDLQNELEETVRTELEEDVMVDSMPQLHADMMANLTADLAAEEPSLRSNEDLLPNLQSSQDWEADLHKELEAELRAQQESDAITDGISQLHADMMADLADMMAEFAAEGSKQSEPLQSSVAWEANLQREMKADLALDREEEAIGDGIAQLHADMMGDLVAEDHLQMGVSGATMPSWC